MWGAGKQWRKEWARYRYHVSRGLFGQRKGISQRSRGTQGLEASVEGVKGGTGGGMVGDAAAARSRKAPSALGSA